MRVATSPTYKLRLGPRFLAGLLSLLMIVSPVAGQTSANTSSQGSGSSSSKSQKTKKSAQTGKKGKKTSGRKARSARTARIKQAFVASAELRPMAQQLATMRTPAAYAGVTKYAHKHSGEAAAAAYLALGHAYLVDKRYAEAEANLRQARQAGDVLADYADFLGAQANHEAGNDSAAEALLRGFTVRYPDSIFAALKRRSWKPTCCWPWAMRRARRRCWRQAAGTCGRRPARFPACAGTGGSSALGQDAGGGAHLQTAAAGPSVEPGGGDCAGQADGDGRGDQPDHSRIAQPGRCLLQRRTLRRGGGAIPRAGPAGRPRCPEPQRLCRGRGGLRPEAEAADHGPGRGAGRHAGRKRRAAALLIDGTGAEPRRPETSRSASWRRWSPASRTARGWPRRSTPAGICICCARDYATAAEYYSYLATHFPASKYAAAAHWRAGWLSYRQGLYADAARLFDEQIRLYPGATETVRRSTGVGVCMRRRTTSPPRPRPTTAPWFGLTSTSFMRRWRGNGWLRWAIAGQPCCAAAATGPLSGAAGAAAGGELSRRQPAPGQGAPAGQRGLERIHRAGDCRRSRFLFLERAGRGADLFVLWRDLPRHAGDEEGFALRRHGLHPVHPAGLLADFVSRSRGGRRSRPSRPKTISIRIWWPR